MSDAGYTATTPSSPVLVGVDVSGTKIAVLITTPDGAILGRATRASSAGDQGGAAEAIATTIETALADAGQRAQFELVEAVASAGRPTIAVAIRTPWDAAGYPAGSMAVCTYSILPDSLEALASALAADIPFTGRLPVALPA